MHKIIPMTIRLVSEPERQCNLELTLDVGEYHQVSPGSMLCFSCVRPLQNSSVKGADIVSREGDFYQLNLLSSGQEKGKNIVILSLDQAIKKQSDLPYGIYIELADGQRLAVQCWQSESPAFSNNENYSVLPPADSGDSVLPIPDNSMPLSGSFIMSNGLSLGLPEFLNDSALVELLDLLTGSSLKWVSIDQSDLEFELVESLMKDHYELRIDAEGVVIRGGIAGCRLGLMTLAQLLILSDGKQLSGQIITDGTDIGYRGVHLDVVRHFFTVEQVKKVLRIAAFYKFNFFHWHLTDDDGWRVESDVLPDLHLGGGWRGPDDILPPQLGSGANRYGGFYTKKEIKEVVAYAGELGIQIVPEMDLPGHARVLTRHYPDQFVDPNDESEYLSVQHHNDNVINVAMDATWKTLTLLIDEWLELFPGNLFHIGSDEVPDGAWIKSPVVLELMAREDLSNVDELHGWFLRRIELYLNEHGRTCAGWEELMVGNSVSEKSWIYSWQGVEAGLKAMNEGHPVVMTPAQHCYLDLAYSEQFDDAGYYWAGTINIEKCLALSQTLQPHWQSGLKGVQACLWSELIVDEKRLDFMLFPRIIALSQVAWSKNIITESQFKPLLQRHQQIWSRLGVKYGRSAEFW